MQRAVAKIFNDNVFSNSDFVTSGQQWRVNYLWNIHIDDLYKANMGSLRTIFNVSLNCLCS